MSSQVIEQPALPALLHEAAQRLENATTAAEVLEARGLGNVAYDAAKSATRLAMATKAHDDVVAAARRAQADAAEIVMAAERRLAVEYDVAKTRGEVQGHGGDRVSKIEDADLAPTLKDLGLTAQEIHEGRQIDAAETAEPGVVRRVLDERLAAGKEPTKAAVRAAAQKVIARKRAKGPTRAPAPKTDAAREFVRPFVEAGEPVSQGEVAEATGSSVQVAKVALAAETAFKAGKEVVGEIDLATFLSKTAQEKLASLDRRREAAFDQRVQAEVTRRINEDLMPYYKERLDAADMLHAAMRKPFTYDEYRVILTVVHPDNSASQTKRNEAFRLVKEKALLLAPAERERPLSSGLPRSLAELKALRRRAR